MILNWLLRRKLNHCEFQLLSIEHALEYENMSDEKEINKLLKIYENEVYRKKILKCLI